MLIYNWSELELLLCFHALFRTFQSARPHMLTPLTTLGVPLVYPISLYFKEFFLTQMALTWCDKGLRRCHTAAHIHCLGLHLSALWFLAYICGDYRESTLPCDGPWVGGTLARGLYEWSRLDGDRSLLKAQGLQTSGLRGGARPLMTAKGKILNLEPQLKNDLI